MKIRVINSELPLYNRELKVKSINFDMVIAEEGGEVQSFNMEDVKLIPETKYEELISSYKDILKVKLNNEVSPALYAFLIDYIEEKIGERLQSLEVIEDSYNISNRGIWEKKLLLIINKAIPVEVVIVALKYSDEFSITIKDISLQGFIEGCSENIKHIKKEIEEKQKSLNRYKNTLKEVLENSIKADTVRLNKEIAGA